jgi:hypothetical protein
VAAPAERRRLTLAQARRLALGAQGLDRPRPAGRVDVRHLRRVVADLGLLQLDYVNVLVPAHYLVLFSRLGPYDRSLFDDFVYRRRELTEAWARERSVVPVETWPLLHHRRQEHRPRPWGFRKFLTANPEYVKDVLDRVRAHGPLTPDDVAEPEGVEKHLDHTWFGTGAAKAVLEAHFGFGDLAIADRLKNFARVYDVVERVVPQEHRAHRVGTEEAQRRLLLTAARGHGVATAGDLADYWRMKVTAARPRLAELVAAGELLEADVEGWTETAFLDPSARLPRRVDAASLLSPFDPLVWTRARVARLFELDYVVELFVPAKKRRWGYYVLPFLLGDRLVARVDLKAERGDGRVHVAAAYRESHAEADVVAAALAAELRTLAAWLGLDEISVGRRGDFTAPLRAALRS